MVFRRRLEIEVGELKPVCKPITKSKFWINHIRSSNLRLLFLPVIGNGCPSNDNRGVAWLKKAEKLAEGNAEIRPSIVPQSINLPNKY